MPAVRLPATGKAAGRGRVRILPISQDLPWSKLYTRFSDFKAEIDISWLLPENSRAPGNPVRASQGVPGRSGLRFAPHRRRNRPWPNAHRSHGGCRRRVRGCRRASAPSERMTEASKGIAYAAPVTRRCRPGADPDRAWPSTSRCRRDVPKIYRHDAGNTGFRAAAHK